jgi:regulator of RNase E activity RraA
MTAPLDLTAIAERVSCSAICDAMMRRHGHRAHICDLVSPAPDRWILAEAVTMLFMPLRADLFDPARHDFGALVIEAAGEDPAGKVLVASCGGYPEQPIAGGKKLSRLANLGMAGVVSDARLRDFSEVVDLGIAAWVSGETVRQGGETIMPFAANVPVAVGGVTVIPGDWVYADRSGAVVIPPDDLRAVLEEAARIEQRDAEIVARMRDDDRTRLARI